MVAIPAGMHRGRDSGAAAAGDMTKRLGREQWEHFLVKQTCQKSTTATKAAGDGELIFLLCKSMTATKIRGRDEDLAHMTKATGKTMAASGKTTAASRKMATAASGKMPTPTAAWKIFLMCNLAKSQQRREQENAGDRTWS